VERHQGRRRLHRVEGGRVLDLDPGEARRGGVRLDESGEFVIAAVDLQQLVGAEGVLAVLRVLPEQPRQLAALLLEGPFHLLQRRHNDPP
jgi:hypothetical protein